MAGTRLFPPSDSLKGRDLQDDRKDTGLIANPPRYAELGGLTKSVSFDQNVAPFKNKMTVKMPGSTIRKVPVG